MTFELYSLLCATQVLWWLQTTSVPLASACHLGVTAATVETEKRSVTSSQSSSPTTVVSVSRLHSQLMLLYIIGHMRSTLTDRICPSWLTLKLNSALLRLRWSFTVCTSKSDLCDLCLPCGSGQSDGPREREIPLKWHGWEGGLT